MGKNNLKDELMIAFNKTLATFLTLLSKYISKFDYEKLVTIIKEFGPGFVFHQISIKVYENKSDILSKNVNKIVDNILIILTGIVEDKYINLINKQFTSIGKKELNKFVNCLFRFLDYAICAEEQGWLKYEKKLDK